MRRLLVLSVFLSSCVAFAQAPSSTAHQAALQLVSAMQLRENITRNVDKQVAAGQDAMLRNDPSTNRDFLEEWGKRMKARLDPEVFAAAAVRVYESHFSAAELEELTQATKDKLAGKTSTLSPALQAKVSGSMTTVQSEIFGAFSQIGAKLGGDVGMELQKEHPEWFKKDAPGASPKL